MKKTPAPCGTYAAYQRHRAANEDACVPCKAAANDYQAAYRRANPQSVRQRTATQTAWRRAASRLAAAHRQEFDRLYRTEKRKIMKEAQEKAVS